MLLINTKIQDPTGWSSLLHKHSLMRMFRNLEFNEALIGSFRSFDIQNVLDDTNFFPPQSAEELFRKFPSHTRNYCMTMRKGCVRFGAFMQSDEEIKLNFVIPFYAVIFHTLRYCMHNVFF